MRRHMHLQCPLSKYIWRLSIKIPVNTQTCLEKSRQGGHLQPAPDLLEFPPYKFSNQVLCFPTSPHSVLLAAEDRGRRQTFCFGMSGSWSMFTARVLILQTIRKTKRITMTVMLSPIRCQLILGNHVVGSIYFKCSFTVFEVVVCCSCLLIVSKGSLICFCNAFTSLVRLSGKTLYRCFFIFIYWWWLLFYFKGWHIYACAPNHNWVFVDTPRHPAF